MTAVSLWMTEAQAEVLQKHLFPGDGKEAVAVALCGRAVAGDYAKLSVHHIECIPHAECHVREYGRLVWPTDRIVPLLYRAEREKLSIVKLHSHPGGYAEFSRADDHADTDLFECVTTWLPDAPHASVVMLPGRRFFGRSFTNQAPVQRLRLIGIVGDRIHVCSDSTNSSILGQDATHQVLGARTTNILGALRIAVIGASGTGSLVVEQLLRSGVAELIVVDDDVILDRNLNRIVNATVGDARTRRGKVAVVTRTSELVGLGTKITALPVSLLTPEAIRHVATADALFGCVDTALARAVMNRIATFHTMPYFDLGVRVNADGNGGIEYVGGAVHYLQPGRSTLQSRNAIDGERLRAEWLALTDPDALDRLRGEGYLKGTGDQRPVVMPLNMHIASLAVLEFLTRLHGFRVIADGDFATQSITVSHGFRFHEAEGAGPGPLFDNVGRGECRPRLGLPAFEAWLQRATEKLATAAEIDLPGDQEKVTVG